MIIILGSNLVPAQKVKIEFGGSLGIERTQLIPDFEIKYESFTVYERNFQSREKNQSGLGYHGGVLFRISLPERKLYFQTDLSLSRIESFNTYFIDYNWYLSAYPEGGKSGMFQQFTTVAKTLNIPVVVGFQKRFKERISYGLFGGISANCVIQEEDGGIIFKGSDDQNIMFLSYLAGLQTSYRMFFISFDFARSIGIRNPEWDFSPYFKINKVIINSFGISAGIKINLSGV